MTTLKNAKENLEKSEKKALDEVRDLTERVHRLQVFFLSLPHSQVSVYVYSFCVYVSDILLFRLQSTQSIPPRRFKRYAVLGFKMSYGNVWNIYRLFFLTCGDYLECKVHGKEKS